MKKTRYSDEQIVRILRETDKDTVVEVAKRHGVSEATIYIWCKKYGSMETDEVKRLKGLEAENARQRKLLVDRDLEIDVMKEINAKKMVGAQARLVQARYAISRGVCQRRACALMEVSRSGLYYTLRMPMKDAPVAQAMQRLSGQYPRFGSRHIRVFLGREGIQVGQERCSRLWRQAGCKYPPSASGERRSPVRSPGHAHHPAGTASGVMTSCSTPAPTGRH